MKTPVAWSKENPIVNYDNEISEIVFIAKVQVDALNWAGEMCSKRIADLKCIGLPISPAATTVAREIADCILAEACRLESEFSMGKHLGKTYGKIEIN